MFKPNRTEILIVLVALVGGAGLFHEWRVSHDALTQMQAQIGAQEQARKQTQDELKVKLEDIERVKQRVVTVHDVAQALPKFVDLPVPPVEVAPLAPVPVPAQPAPNGRSALPDAPPTQHSINGTIQNGLFIPAEDTKSLFDKLADCAACQAQTDADRATIADLTRERDSAVRAAKGGGFWRRLLHDSKTLAIGALAGGVLICASGHCK